MALELTRYTDSNTAYPDASTSALAAKSFAWLAKALLKGEATGTNGPSGAPPAGSKWTCAGSSDSASANMTGTDLWGSSFDQTKIVRGTGGAARSWWVGQSPNGLGAAGPYYFCIHYNGSADGVFELVVSKTAFTGGSTTARPTATEEIAFGTFTLSDLTAAATHRMTLVRTANGEFMIKCARNGAGVVHTFIMLAALTETRTGDNRNVVFVASSATSGRGAPTEAQLLTYNASTGGVGMRSPNGAELSSSGGATNGMFSHASFVSSTQANAADSKYDAFPLYFQFKSTTYQGIRGRVPDCYIANAARSVGDVEPATGDSERDLCGVLLVPNGGVALLL